MEGERQSLAPDVDHIRLPLEPRRRPLGARNSPDFLESPSGIPLKLCIANRHTTHATVAAIGTGVFWYRSRK